MRYTYKSMFGLLYLHVPYITYEIMKRSFTLSQVRASAAVCTGCSRRCRPTERSEGCTNCPLQYTAAGIERSRLESEQQKEADILFFGHVTRKCGCLETRGQFQAQNLLPVGQRQGWVIDTSLPELDSSCGDN